MVGVVVGVGVGLLFVVGLRLGLGWGWGWVEVGLGLGFQDRLAKTQFFQQSKTLAIDGWVVVVDMVENKAFSGPKPQVFPTGLSVAIIQPAFDQCF